MRKTNVVIVKKEGRDKGRSYFLTEMSATAADWWATRAVMELIKSGMDFGDSRGSPIEMIVGKGVMVLANVSPFAMKPLLDELLTCVEFMPDPIQNPTFKVPVTDDNLEEVATRFDLKMEVFQLMTGFSMPAAPSPSTSAPSGTGLLS